MRFDFEKKPMRKVNKILDMLWARKNVQGSWESERLDNLQSVIEKLGKELGYEVDVYEGEVRKIK